MSQRQRIPRPRHLFPELSALLIEWKRSHIRIRRSIRNAIGTVPVWVTGSVAGIASVMLTISLFFVHEPVLQAASVSSIPTPVITPPPVVEPEPTPAFISKAQLSAEFVRTYFPFSFDPNHLTVRSSRDQKIESPQLNAAADWMNDRWTKSVSRLHQPTPFDSYLIAAAGLPSTWHPMLASNVVTIPLTSPPSLDMGILVDKSVLGTATPGDPITYEIRVYNSTGRTIERLDLREWISEAQRVTAVEPPAGVDRNDLVWNVQNITPGETKSFRITLIPEGVGEIQTVTELIPTSRIGAVVAVSPARVIPEPVRTPDPDPIPESIPASPAPEEYVPSEAVPAGKPELRLTYTEVKPLREGETLSMIFTVSNVGTAPAEEVQLFVHLTGEFEHRYGDFVKHQIGVLPAGQSRRALLQAVARDPGEAKLDVSLKSGGSEKAGRELRVPIQREQPQAQLQARPEATAPVATQRNLSQPIYQETAPTLVHDFDF
ncbi:hypothetical protein SH668x_003595 [Planctomicrobium sp. SH668]|uniref:hypothetical protein n=1 Tax=Planctomicrobium sp. SH668 TaxID=3448126 RepID=UPI003F5B9A11